ncbi:MAG: hypothetical protein NC177_08395 [Ruminococcus flavefaciens]|nr:hypothetical protein [Ruminococcus flavefaciens]
MKKNSVKPVKVKPVKKSKSAKNTCKKCHVNFNKGLGMGFVLGFATGAAIVAVVDYLDEKHNEMRRIEKGSNADYYYNTTD